MEKVLIFKHVSTLSAEELNAITEKIKEQAAGGVIVLDREIELVGVIDGPERCGAVAFPVASEPVGGLVLPVTKRALERVSLADLKAAIVAGRGPSLVEPFDEFPVTLDTGEIVTVVCAGYVGKNRARFVFKDCHWSGKMNDDATNEGGYFKSKGRRHVLENIYPHLPPELRAVIEPRPLVETIDGEKVEYSDPIWLPSATDVFGPGDWWAEEPDSVQLEIFKRGERGRVKEQNGETVFWWLRSPYRSSASYFVHVGTDGTVYSCTAYCSLAFAPGFDL